MCRSTPHIQRDKSYIYIDNNNNNTYNISESNSNNKTHNDNDNKAKLYYNLQHFMNESINSLTHTYTHSLPHTPIPSSKAGKQKYCIVKSFARGWNIFTHS